MLRTCHDLEASFFVVVEVLCVRTVVRRLARPKLFKVVALKPAITFRSLFGILFCGLVTGERTVD